MGSLLKSRIKSRKLPSDAKASVGVPVLPLPVKDAEYRELLRVLVDSSGQKIALEVDGKRYEAISHVKDRFIGQRILETTAMLLKFTGGYIAAADGTKTLPTPKVKLTALPPEPALASTSPAPPAPQVEAVPLQPSELSPAATGFLADIEASRQDFPQQKSPKKSSFWGRGFGKKNKSIEPKVPSFNLAGEIDEIVQQKLRQADAGTQVKIQSGAGGMVRFQVGGKIYEAVDQIEDAGIQTIIKSAIDEWNG